PRLSHVVGAPRHRAVGAEIAASQQHLYGERRTGRRRVVRRLARARDQFLLSADVSKSAPANSPENQAPTDAASDQVPSSQRPCRRDGAATADGSVSAIKR